MTDSPGFNYRNAPQRAEPVITAITTAAPINLAACPNPVLTFRHDYILAKVGTSQDLAQVELSTDNGATWQPLAGPFGGGDIYDTPPESGREPASGPTDQEWTDLHWKSEQISLGDYAGQAILLRFALTADHRIADRGWIIDEVKISGDR